MQSDTIITSNHVERKDLDSMIVVTNDRTLEFRNLRKNQKLLCMRNSLWKDLLKETEMSDVNVCTLCFKTLNVVLQRKEHQALREKGSTSVFVEFYEKMHLNTLDLRRSITNYKQLVNTITDSGSPQIKRAKELENSISIMINELKTGVAKLKELKMPTQKQSQVILHVHHAFLTHLNAVLPDFKLYSTELASKMKIPPGSSPTTIKSPVNTLKNTTSSSTGDSTSPISQSPGSTGISPGGSNGSSSRLSTFFSSVFNLGESNTPNGHRRTGSNNSSSGGGYNRPAYEDLPDKSTILSVVPAVCPLAGGCIAIQGENLDKHSIQITIDGYQVKVLQKKSYALLIASPARNIEGEYDLVIKDGEHLLSRQALFYTNSCFQTEKDIEDSNRYALDHFNKSGMTGNEYSQSSSPIFTSSPTLGSHQYSYFNDSDEEDEKNNENKILAEIVGNIEQNMLQQDNATSQSDSIAATGNSFDDLVIQMITPVVTPCTGGKITMHLKYPLVAGAIPLVTVGSIPVNIEIGSQRKSISFIAPPSSQQGFHTIEIMYQSKYIDLPNVLFYQPDMQALTGNNQFNNNSNNNYQQHHSSSSTNNLSSHHSTPTMSSTSSIPRSTRVWGKK
ncbi:IPT/TIG domain-containing protein [Heterostelium album PN500]|uniref:IPT/TIG domain-containing protein n=1 Tax=Heterostelium pallidum (strain ATCC 26659 / Pp 5 / PN500) TaxID=670386 RepID=D3BTK6_HETP5|nr:IPT/TIG domain-containing protein [Heterostelium album PN500]EFA75423.1 IPT/TIG domain-containing protein [Heterostelium album PN500]|eukprot:XP_020427557.1 IPT/TIG domain-containing protein [Heterostelium album PN500]